MQNLNGKMVGQYELRYILGIGGMSVVYSGYQINLKREVAVKILSPQLALQPDYIERFTREAETAARLEHPHIVPVYDYGTEDGLTYVVMRLLTGGTLAQRMAQRAETSEPLPSLGELSTLLTQLASALDYAHSQGVLHRDIKPSNIMFDNQGTAYIVDYGIAKLLESTSTLTGTGVSMGTPSYMSPEQWRAEDLSPATDQYALGAMMYLLLTGEPPFKAPTPYALMHKHLHELPTPPQVVRPDVPDAVAHVLGRAMAKKAADRFPTCTAFSEAFGQAIQGSTGEPTNFFTMPVRSNELPAVPMTPISPGAAVDQQPTLPVYKHPLVWGAGFIALALVILIALVLVILLRGDNNDTESLQTQQTRLALEQTRLALNTTATALALGVTATPAFSEVDLQSSATASALGQAFTATAQAMGSDLTATTNALNQIATATQSALDNNATATALAALLVTAESTLAAVTTPAPAVAIVKQNGLPIHSGPGTQYPVIGTALRRQHFPVTGQAQDWYLVTLPDGSTGWLDSQRVTLDPPDAILETVEAPPLEWGLR